MRSRSIVVASIAMHVYPDLVGADPNVPFEAYCRGGLGFNGFYGVGIVNALAAVS